MSPGLLGHSLVQSPHFVSFTEHGCEADSQTGQVRQLTLIDFEFTLEQVKFPVVPRKCIVKSPSPPCV
jgi:hypothetical protein